ncbi:MAG: hypothetical protein JXA17_07375 [Dehalococcoidales bacterium]|nr:hypothetical protein [Dehalococcoidales bacterium]
MKRIGRVYRDPPVCGEAGQALILVLVFLLLGSLTIFPTLMHMSTALKSGVSYENKTREYYAADAGIEDGIWQIKYDRLPALSGDPYFAYDFTAICSYDIDDTINGLTTSVTIENFWIPTVANPYASPAQAKATLERDITDNTTNRLVVTDTAMDDTRFRIKIDYYACVEVADNLSVSSIGIWIPHGYSYDGNCNMANFEGTEHKYVETVQASPGGQVVVWDFSSNPIIFPDLPPEDLDPSDNPQSAEIIFDYAADEAGTRPVAVGWIVTAGLLSADIPMAWDIDTKYYKIVSAAGGTQIEAYASRCDLRQVGASFLGDYCAIGNTLMRDTDVPKDNIRDTLDSSSTADTRNPDLTYRIPSDATVLAQDGAFLYWSGWFKCAEGYPKATIFADDCDSLTNWSQNGTAWDVSYVFFQGYSFRGHYDGSTDDYRYLSLVDPVNLSGRIPGSVVVGWTQRESGTLEPISDPTSGDALLFQISNDNGASWSSPIMAFDDDLDSSEEAYFYIIPANYLTANFKIRFYLHGFSEGTGSSTEYCRIDDIHIGAVADTSITFKIGNPLAPDYAGSLTADEFWILGNAATGEYSYSCKKDVSALVATHSLEGDDENRTGNGEYTVEGVDADTGQHWSYAAWSLIIIYSSPATAGHQLYLFDRFAFCQKDVNLDFDFDGEPGGDISGFIIPEPIEGETLAAKLTCFVGEGDDAWHDDFIALNAPEEYRPYPWNIPNTYKLWDGITTGYNSQASPNNVWNSKFRVGDTGSSSIDGIDIDTFRITWASGLLHADDTSAHIDIYTDYENFNLIYLILSVRSETTIGGTTHYLISGS